jgi:hypothetical protein
LDTDDSFTVAFCAFWRGVGCRLKGDEANVQHELAQLASLIPQVTDPNQQRRLQALLALFEGQTDAAREHYAQIVRDNPKIHQLFSPRLYLRLLRRLFPAREDIHALGVWFEAQI